MINYNFIFRTRQETLILDGEEYQSISGPYGNGALPPGEYHTSTTLAPNAGHYFPSGFVGPDGFAFGIKLIPQFPTSRGGLWVHPDGNVIGTLGCIGVHPSQALPFWEHYNDVNPGWETMVLYVEERTVKADKVYTYPVTYL